MLLFCGVLVAHLAVTISTQHPTILRYRFAALAPRDDVVTLHVAKLEVLTTQGAVAALLFVLLAASSFVKLANAQAALIAR